MTIDRKVTEKECSKYTEKSVELVRNLQKIIKKHNNFEIKYLEEFEKKVDSIYEFGGEMERKKQHELLGVNSIFPLMTKNLPLYCKLMHERVKAGYTLAKDFVCKGKIPEGFYHCSRKELKK